MSVAVFPHTLFMNTEIYISYHFHVMKDDSPFGIFPITFKYKNHFQLLSCKKTGSGGLDWATGCSVQTPGWKGD